MELFNFDREATTATTATAANAMAATTSDGANITMHDDDAASR